MAEGTRTPEGQRHSEWNHYQIHIGQTRNRYAKGVKGRVVCLRRLNTWRPDSCSIVALSLLAPGSCVGTEKRLIWTLYSSQANVDSMKKAALQCHEKTNPIRSLLCFLCAAVLLCGCRSYFSPLLRLTVFSSTVRTAQFERS